MKKIIIYQENSEPLILYDNDSTDLISYTKKVTEILESSKVCILQTTFQIVSLKPSKLNSILVTEVEDVDVDKKAKEELDKEKAKEEKRISEENDVIKD